MFIEVFLLTLLVVSNSPSDSLSCAGGLTNSYSPEMRAGASLDVKKWFSAAAANDLKAMEEIHARGEAGLTSGDMNDETVIHKVIRSGNLASLRTILSFDWLVREANRRPNIFNFPAVLPFALEPKQVASPRLLKSFERDVRAAYVLMTVLRIKNKQGIDALELANLSNQNAIQDWLEGLIR